MNPLLQTIRLNLEMNSRQNRLKVLKVTFTIGGFRLESIGLSLYVYPFPESPPI